MELDRLLLALDPATPPGASLVSALSDEARRRKWERTSQRIVKAAQDKVSQELAGQAAPHRSPRDELAPE
jgi:hypothetical protein